MPDPIVDAALDRGALIVTPNKRLAREIAARHDRAQVAAGKSTWPAARVMPWTTFVAELVQIAHDAGLSLPLLYLDPAQANWLWRSIVSADLEARPLIDVDATIGLAIEAWERAHAYGAGLEGWRGFAGGEDIDAFVRWAGAYSKELGRLGAVDAARAPDLLATVAGDLPGVALLDVVVAGFIELSPQQKRLLRALDAAGARTQYPSGAAQPIADSAAHLVACDTSRDELGRALDWARAHALRDPKARIGVVVLDLEQRRAAVRAMCEDRLCAPMQWPGQHDQPRPYDISLGLPLSEVPLVASALTLIALDERAVETSRLAALIRGPYLAGGTSDWMRRAALERTWLDQGIRALAWHALIGDLERVDANLAARWRGATGEQRRASRLTPRAWVERWRGRLNALGWCEGRSLSSAEYQADGAWNELLGTFARLAAVAPTLSGIEAVAMLESFAREHVFQPEAPGARISVLGILEATGLTFDALWVAGMTADAWPRSPQPNPLLPLAWQREHGVPRASADGELRFAREVTARLAHAASEVAFSYAVTAEDHRRTPSPLVAGLFRIAASSASPTMAERMFAQRPALETIADRVAPPLLAGSRLPGGTGVLEAQSACPFRATAVYRLKAEPWPVTTLGLTPIERGKLVHATLDAFWRRTRTHAQLLAMDEAAVASSVAAAFDEAKAVLSPARWASLPVAIAAVEGPCVCRLVGQWLHEFERERPPFTVVETERRATVALGGYTLDLRIDRVDALASGGVAVIDYKCGFAIAPPRWFEPRPQGMQVALYARACEQAAPETPVSAVVYAQLRRGEMKPVGVCAEAPDWPSLTRPVDIKGAGLVDWEDVRARQQATLEHLAAAFGEGDAAIVPRDRKKVCTLCGLHAVCRIGTPFDDAPADAEGYDDD